MDARIRVEDGTKVVQRSFPGADGKSQIARSQTDVYLVGASKYPLEVRLRLGADQPPFGVGDYDIEPGGLFQLERDSLKVRFDVALVPLTARSAKS